ncbi:MAG: hypothetical protein FWD39_04000, partial [Clostridiales bacterium]|nr:hypothetical protein [Clostridiales bacterium]
MNKLKLCYYKFFALLTNIPRLSWRFFIYRQSPAQPGTPQSAPEKSFFRLTRPAATKNAAAAVAKKATKKRLPQRAAFPRCHHTTFAARKKPHFEFHKYINFS